MRIARTAVLLAVAFKVVALGGWWWGRPALAPRDAEAAKEEPAAAGAAPVPGDLLARSRGFRALPDAVRKRGADLDQREQAVAAREAALKTLAKTVADEVTRLETLGRPEGAAPAAAGGAAGGVPVTKIYESMKPDEA